jgi:ABC-type antimicrobial peptide transport system permease subunit
VLTGVGLGLGLAMSWASTRAIQALLVGVASTDPVTFGGVVALLLLVAFGASAVPALRAARIDPLRVLRQD